MHSVLLQWHVMVGLDFHDEITVTTPPAPAPNVPHLAGHVLNGWGLPTTKLTPPAIRAMGMQIVLRDSDIGNGIPHVPIPPWPPVGLLPLVFAFSGSKSHFGPGAVKAENQPIGAALGHTMSANLNCNTIAPFPTGLVFAPSTVVCGMTMGDILGGLFAMAVDSACGAVVNKATGGFGRESAKAVQDTIIGLVQMLVGSPLGWSMPWFFLPDGAAPVGAAAGRLSGWARSLGEALGDIISPPPVYGPPAATRDSTQPVAPEGGPIPGGAHSFASPAELPGAGAPFPSFSSEDLRTPFEPPPLSPHHPAAQIFDDPDVEQFG